MDLVSSQIEHRELPNEDSFHTAPEEEETKTETSGFAILQDYVVQYLPEISVQHDLITEIINEMIPCLSTRLNKEIKVLIRGLPCLESNSIFVGVDSANMQLMKALIAGSDGTPYAHGLFEFHVAIPNTFPVDPPKLNLHTGLINTVAFSPNLYNNGYVCLSVINTWSSSPEDMWTPDKNILQVLLSIQALVMDNMIIQKEPGYNDLDEKSWDNLIYQDIIKYATVQHTMIDVLKNPPKGFEKIVDNYFALKKEVIIRTINK